MQQSFSAEEGFQWEQQGCWEEDSHLSKLLTDFVPLQTQDQSQKFVTQKFLRRESVLVVGLLLCHGDIEEKASQLFDLAIGKYGEGAEKVS